MTSLPFCFLLTGLALVLLYVEMGGGTPGGGDPWDGAV